MGVPSTQGTTRRIPLTNGGYALVDAGDYERVCAFAWYLTADGYAARTERSDGAPSTVMMHRFILGLHPGALADHSNRVRTDNRRANVRVVTHAENALNARTRRDNTTGYRGVGFYAKYGCFRARIRHRGRLFHLGYFSTPEAAARAYNEKATELFGEYATLNNLQGA
jgi:hypothetical protein